jgi:site-specific DNA-methyltransferase (adenine-specific)
MSWAIIQADARQIPLQNGSVDVILTDPPYGLEFMGKEWDHGIPGVDFWLEALRVLKPGGYLLAFGGTRTFHRLTCAIEDAGFEIRDCMMWLYGSGFPKSLDVSKAIDKTRIDYEDICRIALWLRPYIERTGFDVVTAHFGFKDQTMARARWTSKSQPELPTWQQWLQLKSLCNFGDEMDSEVLRLNGRKRMPGEAWYEREIVGERGRSGKPPQYMWGKTDGQKWNETAPATDAAKEWQGWGTGLKPAWEPIIIARKPIEGTVAENVQKYGTGAMNIDAGRIGVEERIYRGHGALKLYNHGRGDDGRGADIEFSATGRWPANLILSHHPECELRGTEDWNCHENCPVRLLDEQSGDLTSPLSGSFQREMTSRGYDGGGLGQRRAVNHEPIGLEKPGYGDSGGASRFFYTTKADKQDRGDGNIHPTVKPQSIIEYLLKLVSRPGSVVLDMFAGSGTTVLVADKMGRRAIGLDNDRTYSQSAHRRCYDDAPLLNFI